LPASLPSSWPAAVVACLQHHAKRDLQLGLFVVYVGVYVFPDNVFWTMFHMKTFSFYQNTLCNPWTHHWSLFVLGRAPQWRHTYISCFNSSGLGGLFAYMAAGKIPQPRTNTIICM
jgi:hypothetical protein